MKSLLTIVCLVIALSAVASADVIWQIGQFDNNFEEFAIAHNGPAYPQTFPQDVTFRVGTDDPGKAWSFIHPGPADKWAGSKAHPFTIIFDMPIEPSGTYVLTIDMVNTHPTALPTYRININGESGQMQLPAGNSDQGTMDASKGKEYVLSLPVAASTLHRGKNKITLECTAGSWLIYDALSLAEGTQPTSSTGTVTLKPTMRLIGTSGGEGLMHVIELSAQFPPGMPELLVEVRTDAGVGEHRVYPDLLGSVNTELWLAEVSKPMHLEVSFQGRSEKASCEVVPVRHWKVYVQPSSHVDIGYTDYQERIAESQNQSVDLALDLIGKYPEFKWNTEAAWVEDNFLTTMPEDRRAEFIKQARAGRMGCQAIYGNMLTGILSHEEFIRDLYYAHSMAKKYGIPFDIAMSSDVPTQVWTMPTVLAGAGIKYYSAGLNITRGGSFDKLFGKSPFYWHGPDGSEVLTWLSLRYKYATRIGLTVGLEESKALMEEFLKTYDRADYPYDAVLGFGGYGDNRPLEAVFAETVDEWNSRYAYPKVILCRGPEFFKYVETNFRDSIPTIRGDAGVYWEDGAGSSAKETSAVRRAKEKLVAAEKISALTSAFGGTKYPRAEIDLAWKNAILYDEHTWGSSHAIREPQHEQTIHQWAVKAKFAWDAAKQADGILWKSMGDLAKMVRAKEPSALVFNPLSWPMSGYVRVPTSAGKSVVLWAQDVPPVGYKVIPLSEANPGVPIPEPPGPFENQYYRMEIDDNGVVKSLYDKELKRELVDPSAQYGIDQYVYTTAKDTGNRQITDIRDVTDSRITVVAREYRREGMVAYIEGTATRTKWTTEIILRDDCKRIDFVNKIVKEPTFEKEAGYFAFPFALDKPEFYVELPNGVVKPKSQMLPGACMQWYCAQDFVAAADDRSAVVWSAIDSPLVTIGDINRETFQSPLPIDNGHLYAYAFNNYWFTNYKASQGGELVFRFSLTSMPKYDPIAASRFGQSVRNPLLATAIPSTARSASMPTCLTSVSPSNVVIQAVKQAESGGGLIIRLREVAGKKTSAVLSFPGGKFKEAWSCSLVEGPRSRLPIAKGKVAITIPANGLSTIIAK